MREVYGRRTIADAASLMHPEAEMHQPSELPDGDRYHGREQVVRGTRLVFEHGRKDFIAAEVIDLGERAFMRVRLSGRALATPGHYVAEGPKVKDRLLERDAAGPVFADEGPALEAGWTASWIAVGKIAKRRAFRDRADALKAAGLRE